MLRFSFVAPRTVTGHDCHPLTSGQLVRYPNLFRSHELMPLCDGIPPSGRSAPFCFVVQDGQVLFSKRWWP
jgi:hypothetical protein